MLIKNMEHLKTFEQQYRFIDSKEVLANMLRHNPHSGARDVRGAIPIYFNELEWEEQLVDPNDPRLVHCYAHNKRDVNRYAKRMSASPTGVVPHITLSDQGARWQVIDGAHRLEAARLAGKKLWAYIGKLAQ